MSVNALQTKFQKYIPEKLLKMEKRPLLTFEERLFIHKCRKFQIKITFFKYLTNFLPSECTL